MAIFVGVHRLGAATEEEKLANSWNSYKEEARKMGLKPLRVNFSAEKGVAFCETEANSLEEVRLAHEKVGMVPEEIVEVKTAN